MVIAAGRHKLELAGLGITSLGILALEEEALDLGRNVKDSAIFLVGLLAPLFEL